MSKTVQTIITNVRTQLKDTNASDYVVSSDRMLYRVITQIMDTAGRLDWSLAWVSGVVTLADADYDYALDNTKEYGSILAVRRASDRELLQFVPPSVLEHYREGDVVGQGEPYMYALLTSGDASTADVETVTMLVYPTPTSSEAGDTLDALVSYEPVASATTDVIPFPDRAIRAIELSVMAGIVAGLGDEQLQKLQVTREEAGIWDAKAEALMKHEMKRIYNRQRPSGVARTQVY